jgi:serine/threonine-protein kinase
LELEEPDPEEIARLFASALELEPERRLGFVAERCAPSPSMRAAVESLLSAHDSAGDWPLALDLTRAAALVGSVQPPAGERTRVGPYRLLREVGRGGMGTVFLAERVDGGFEQQVALKLLRRGIDTEAVLTRFRRERQILARLEHPGIARLLDGGATADGLPYFAMEYVDGEPITHFAMSRRLGVDARLELFEQVCEAVQEAHRNLVVHRDLKPSNVLVTGEGRVKLVDFGIAKVLHEWPGDASGGPAETALTREGLQPLTPDYASPEQVRGEALTTSSDIYTLGVVLYELLTGRLPYRVAATTPERMVRAVCESVPLPPSTVLGRGREASAPAGGRLEKDLDAIVLAALAKEPARRYRSVEALAEDLRRQRSGLPVRARPPSRLYGAIKFVRRHRAGVAAAVLAAASLILGLAGTAWQAAVAARERDRARQEAVKAGEVKEFVLDLFAVSDPNTAHGESATARELLDRGTVRLRTELAGQPEVQAEMMSVAGEIYRLLGLYDRARPLLERALALRREALGEVHPEVVSSLGLLAALSHATGDYEEAEQLYRRALELERRLHGAEHPGVARWLNGLSEVARARGRYDEAESLARSALAMRRRSLAPVHVDVAESLTHVAVPLYLKREYPEAEQLYREALAIRESLQGDEHLKVAEVRNRLALLLRRQGRHAEAEALFRRTLATYRRSLGPAHPDVAIVLNNLAQVRQAQAEPAAAEPLFREALAIQRQALRPDHPDVAITLSNLGALLHEQGNVEEAEPLFRESLAIWQSAHGEKHPYVALALGNLGELLLTRGDLAGAERFLVRALALLLELHGEDDPRVARARRRLAAARAFQSATSPPRRSR